jgi:tripeptide aminopeptidase
VVEGTGERNDSDAGNLIATVPGDPAAPTLLFVAHMDTVETGTPPVTPVVGRDGVIRSAGDTILGADNKSAVAAVMRLCVNASRMGAAARPTVVAAFTCREESGRMGAGLLDLDSLGVDCAFCVDGSQPIGTVITRSLGQTVFTLTVHGRASHAAAAPESGVNAIAVTAEIVTRLALGRLPDGGSASIAAIAGGAVIDRLSPASLAALGVPATASGVDAVTAALARTPTNSVPELALLRGEVRGYTLDAIESEVARIESTARAVCEARGARCEWDRDRSRMIPPMPGSEGSRALALVREAAESVSGVTYVSQESLATLEANHLAAAAADVVALASGGSDPHQHSESITVTELEQLEALLAAIVERARPGRG